jgi:hypothetical protein
VSRRGKNLPAVNNRQLAIRPNPLRGNESGISSAYPAHDEVSNGLSFIAEMAAHIYVLT